MPHAPPIDLTHRCQPGKRPGHKSLVGSIDIRERKILLPHGDPGVTVGITPAVQFPLSVGPVYFNEAVAPDPTLTSTSVDGGVMFGNLPAGTNTITASKAPFSYATLTFRVQDAVGLYIASPPHATQGTNASGPGLP
jgi:hypothetical protein